MNGTLYGVGVGPGDPELLTLKAVRIMQAAPVIAYIHSVGRDSLSRSIASPHLSGEQDEVAIAMPMEGDRAPGQAAYDVGAKAIAEHLRAGRDVVMLCEGDPLFYGSFMYVMDRLSEDFCVEVVPGVSSVMAGPAAANLCMVERSGVFSVVPATLEIERFTDSLRTVDAAVIVKVGRHLQKVKRVLMELGLFETAQLVIRASHTDECVVALREAPETAPYFSLILVKR